ncbi:hypothetical protein L218DRAFT_1005807 [Marasmius fiardii PR-910]|nr:hypothetical protein L218DRAFT_1005807 [Marasmius fiardii PR-910]
MAPWVQCQVSAGWRTVALSTLDNVDDEEDEDMLDTEQQEVTYGTCIICQENLSQSKSFGMLGMVQPSWFICRQPDGYTSYLNSVLGSPTSMDRSPPSLLSPTFPPQDADAQDEKAGVSSRCLSRRGTLEIDLLTRGAYWVLHQLY